MKKTIARARKFVDENPFLFGYCTGVVVLTSVNIALFRSKTMLLLNDAQKQLLQDGGAVVYELKDQTLHLVNIPAVEVLLENQ